jgi:cell division septation protein DedD
VPELTHDAEDGFHEIQLSGKQLIFLFMATTVVSVVIFLCGVLVGRGVRAERGGEVSTVAAAEAVPAPQTETIPPAVPPSPPAEDELTYHKRLQGGSAPAEQIKPTAEPQPATPPPPAAQTPTEQPHARQTAAAATTPPAGVPTSARPGNWVIQVHALQNRDAASTFVRSLASKGYPAFLLSPSAGAPQIYRVQIGGYRDRDEAEQVAIRLEKEEQFKPAIKRR